MFAAKVRSFPTVFGWWRTANLHGLRRLSWILDVRREGRNGLVQFQAKVVEVALWCRMRAEFVNDGSEVGQRADWGDRWQIRCRRTTSP